MSETWTSESVASLRRLWAEGLSAGRIARRIGGVSRSAVMGKVHRLGLCGQRAAQARTRLRPGKEAEAKAPPRPAAPGRRKAARRPLPAPAAPTPASVPMTSPPVSGPGGPRLLDLTEEMCRWPIGDPLAPGFHFCGRRRAGGLPYCPNCARKAFRIGENRRRRRESNG